MLLLRRFFQFVLLNLLISACQAQQVSEPILGPGDVVRVTVFQNPDLSLEARISELGEVTYPLLGKVKLGGLSTTAAQDKIAKQLNDGGFVVRPQVSIAVVQVKSSQVSILGQVGRPGRYPIESPNARVSEMIAAAGGVLPGGADIVTVVGTRAGKPVKYDVDLPVILQRGDRERDVVVANGDIIHVDRAPNIFIYGEVQRPGAFRWERGMTVLQAMAQAGGLTLRGTERGIRIHRRDAQGTTQIVEPSMTDSVEREDVIYVRESLF